LNADGLVDHEGIDDGRRRMPFSLEEWRRCAGFAKVQADQTAGGQKQEATSPCGSGASVCPPFRSCLINIGRCDIVAYFRCKRPPVPCKAARLVEMEARFVMGERGGLFLRCNSWMIQSIGAIAPPKCGVSPTP